ncbi:LysR family transcriptional regulator [Novosphingobium sp.]|uniref:LysR family transcriptional regulator n=1 Tax=Novosphingobium sp. TaxID=1874826 RepID=UPI0031DAC4C3
MFDTNLLKTFLAVVDARQFTAAGHVLGISQSTVSQHIRRLELACGRPLLERDTHAVSLTPDGAVLADFARKIVDASRQAVDFFAGSAPRGRVRLGISEEITLTRLSALLREIGQAHPLLSIELTVGLSSALFQKLDGGGLDLVLAKRPAGDDRGIVVHRERPLWIAHQDFRLGAGDAVPLVIYPTSSITSSLAMEALVNAGRNWFVACSSESLNGLRAGTLAGLGIMAQSRLLLGDPEGQLVAMGPEAGLPELAEFDFVVVGRSARMSGAIGTLADLIVEKSPALWP